MKIDWVSVVFSVALLGFTAYVLGLEPRNADAKPGVHLLLFGANAIWFGMTAAGLWYRRRERQ